MSLRPSPSPSPGPSDGGKASARQSMGPSARGTPTLVPGSPRPGAQSNARPTSELLGSSGMFQTPEAEALDQWFENLQNYEATLEDMAAASLDVNFKEELGAIEQWFKVLSEAERTAALYSLLQYSTQVQIRFFITVLQQMARADPMTALLSPAMGSMQNQMEASFARLKSPGFKPNMPASPTTRHFAGNRQSLVLDNTPTFLSPESAASSTPGVGATGGGPSDAAATLAHQRAKLNANTAAHPHRISAPVSVSGGVDVRSSWAAAPTLAQVSETSGTQEIVISASRPKSSDFSGSLPSPHLGGNNGEADSWASMVNTPAVALFPKSTQSLDSASNKLNEWNKLTPQASGVPLMGDPTVYRKKSINDKSTDGGSNQHYDDSGNPINGVSQQDQRGRNASGMRNTSGAWGNRGQAPSNNSNSNIPNTRFNNNNDDSNNMNGLGMQLGNFHLGMGSSPLQMPPAAAAAALANMTGPMSPFNMSMLGAMALTPEAQLLAAHLTAANAQGYAHPGWPGMQSMSTGVGNHGHSHLSGVGGGRRTGGGVGGPPSGRSPGLRSVSSAGTGGGGSGSTLKGEEDVDPAILEDIPAWLRSLRLHKYTQNFQDMRWQDIVVLNETQLEAKGVAALGARRKMLKTFDAVKKKMGLEGGSTSAGTTIGSPSGMTSGVGGTNGGTNGNMGNGPSSASV